MDFSERHKKIFTKDNKTLDELMDLLYEKCRYRWCTADVCACMGCCNAELKYNGYTKKDWEEWVKNNPKPKNI